MNSQKTGIFYGWVVFVGLMLIMLVCGTYNTMALFYTPASTDLGVSLTAFAFTATIMMVVMAVSIPFVTQIFNRINIKIFMSVTLICIAAGYYICSLEENIFVFYIVFAFFGIFIGFIMMMLVPIVINNWFVAKASTLIGICSSTLACGGAILSSLGGWLIENYGWRFCFQVWAVITLIVGIPVTVLILRKDPDELGLKPYGSEDLNTSPEGGPQAEDTASEPAGKAKSLTGFYTMAIIVTLTAAANVFYPFINSYLLAQGISTTLAGSANSGLMIGGILGYIIIGMICDRSQTAGILVCIGASIIAYPALTLFGRSIPLIMASSFLVGITYQPSLGVLGPTVANRTFGALNFSRAWSIMVTCISVSGAVASTGWSFIIDLFGYSGGMIITTVFYIISLILLLGLTRRFGK